MSASWNTSLGAGSPIIHVQNHASDILPHLNLLALDGEVVKENWQRKVQRVALRGGIFGYLKICRVNGYRAWLRDFFRGPKAVLEYRNACRLQDLGVPVAQPIACLRERGWWPGLSAILTREIPGGIPLDVYLARDLSIKTRHRLTTALGRFLATMHEAGVIHPDAHPGNFMVSFEPAAQQESEQEPLFSLIDLHSIHFLRNVGEYEATVMLSRFNRWFQLRTHRSDRARFLKAYLAARPGFLPAEDFASFAEWLEDETYRSNLVFWENRLRRWRNNNRETAILRAASGRGYYDRDLPTDFREAFVARPDRFFLPDSGCEIVKDSRTSTVVRLRWGQQDYILKRFNLRSQFGWLKNALRPSPAQRCWFHGRSLIDRQLPTARPLLLLEKKTLGIAGTGYMIFEYVSDSMPLDQAVYHSGLVEQHERIWAENLGRALQLLHDRGVSHRDLKPANVFLQGISQPAIAQPVFLDLVGTELKFFVDHSRRMKNIARLNAGFPPGTVRLSIRLRVLKAYLKSLHGFSKNWVDWKIWWRTIQKHSERKWQRHQRQLEVLD